MGEHEDSPCFLCGYWSLALGQRYWPPILVGRSDRDVQAIDLVLLAALALSACDRVDPNSPLGKRKVIFKDMLKTSEDLGGMLRGRLPFDGVKFSEGAVKLDSLSHQPWQHFPQARDGGESSARAEVWERQARFHELARQLEGVTGELVDATRGQPLRSEEHTSELQSR